MPNLKDLAVNVCLKKVSGSVFQEEIFLIQVPFEICHTTLSVKYQKEAGALVLYLRFVRYYNESTTMVVPVGYPFTTLNIPIPSLDTVLSCNGYVTVTIAEQDVSITNMGKTLEEITIT